MNHCHFCGNNIPDDTDTCTQAGYACDGPKLPENMNQSQPERVEYVRLLKTAPITDTYFREGTTFYSEDYVVNMLLKTRTAEQERVVGIVVGKFDEPHEGTDDVTKEQSDYWVDGYNQALTDITEAIRNKELTD